MTSRFAPVLVGAIGVVLTGCASYSGGYANATYTGRNVTTENGAALGGPRYERLADADTNYESLGPSHRGEQTSAHRYVYRGGRDPVTGKAFLQEGRPLTR